MKEQLQNDVKEAMRAKDKFRLTTLRGLMAAIKQIEVDTRKEVTEEGIIAIIQKEVKKRREAISFAEKAGRSDLIEENENELKILQSYLGAQLDEGKLTEVISGLISGGAANLGQIMGGLKKDYAGKYDGAVASRIAKELLG